MKLIEPLTDNPVQKKRTSWNKGKRKPIVDELGYTWCDCQNPKLTHSISRGTAFCYLCCTPYYH